MSSKAHIKSDFPTAQEVASQLRLPSRRVAELRKQVYDLHIVHRDGSSTLVELKKGHAGSKAAQNGRKNGRSGGVRAAKKR